jgi:hypothetical protein
LIEREGEGEKERERDRDRCDNALFKFVVFNGHPKINGVVKFHILKIQILKLEMRFLQFFAIGVFLTI